jgi:hypothetical protein
MCVKSILGSWLKATPTQIAHLRHGYAESFMQ